MLRSLIAAVIAVSSPSAAISQSGFPDSFDASAAGIRIGDNVETVRARLTEIAQDREPFQGSGRDARIIESEIEMPGGMGTRLSAIGVGYAVDDPLAHVTRRPPRWSDETTSAGFSLSASQETVELIVSKSRFEEPMDFDSVVERIIEKYGEPHAVAVGGGAFFYGFKDGEPITDSIMLESQNLRVDAQGIIQTCLQHIPRTYGPDRSRQDQTPVMTVHRNAEQGQLTPADRVQAVAPAEDLCDAAAGIWIVQDVEGRAMGVDSRIVDIAAMMTDLEALAPHFVEEISTGSTDVPKL